MKILLIEDNEEIANGLSYTFKENNYEFYHVNSLDKAKNIINKIDFKKLEQEELSDDIIIDIERKRIK